MICAAGSQVKVHYIDFHGIPKVNGAEPNGKWLFDHFFHSMTAATHSKKVFHIIRDRHHASFHWPMQDYF